MTEKPIFRWNGMITEDETSPLKQVCNYKLTENQTLYDFLMANKDKTIVLLATNDNFINDNILRAYID